MVSSGKLKEPETKVVVLEGSDKEVEETVRELMKSLEEGRTGKKILLHWQDETK